MSRRASRRPIRAVGVLQALVLYASLILVAGTVVGELTRGVLVGSMLFLAWRYGVVRALLCRDLRDGMALARVARHQDALKAFARSAEAWQGRATIDDWRGLLLGSASRWPFRHLSRYNEAWCLVRLGHVIEARAVLGSLLQEQPEMQVAQDLLASLDADLDDESSDNPGFDDDRDPAGSPGAAGDWHDLLQDEPTIDPRGASEA